MHNIDTNCVISCRSHTGPKFDVIIMDICDPIEAGPGVVLYFQEFYQSIAKCVIILL